MRQCNDNEKVEQKSTEGVRKYDKGYVSKAIRGALVDETFE